MSIPAAGVPFLGLGLAFLKGLFLCPLAGRRQNEELSLVRGGEWQVDAAFLMPSHPHLLFCLFFLQGSMTVKRGAEREQFGTGLDFQSNIYNALFIYKSSPGEKEWFLAELYVRLKEKQNSTASSLGYSLFLKK